MKEAYNGKPTTGQMIVIVFAVYGFMRLIFDLQGCQVNHRIGAGMGKQVASGDVWTREHPTYARVFYKGDYLIHPRDAVYFYWGADHKSHPGRRDRGEENIELGLEKLF